MCMSLLATGRGINSSVCLLCCAAMPEGQEEGEGGTPMHDNCPMYGVSSSFCLFMLQRVTLKREVGRKITMLLARRARRRYARR